MVIIFIVVINPPGGLHILSFLFTFNNFSEYLFYPVL